MCAVRLDNLHLGPLPGHQHIAGPTQAVNITALKQTHSRDAVHHQHPMGHRRQARPSLQTCRPIAGRARTSPSNMTCNSCQVVVKQACLKSPACAACVHSLHIMCRLSAHVQLVFNTERSTHWHCLAAMLQRAAWHSASASTEAAAALPKLNTRTEHQAKLQQQVALERPQQLVSLKHLPALHFLAGLSSEVTANN